MLDCDNNIVILWEFYVSSDRKTITQVDFEISYRPSTLSRYIKLADIVSNYPQLCFLKVQTTIGHNKLKSTAPHEFDSHKRLRFFLCATVVTRWWYHIFLIIISHSWQLYLYDSYVCLNECNKFLLHFFNMIRKINALYLCNNKYHQRSRIREKLPFCHVSALILSCAC